MKLPPKAGQRLVIPGAIAAALIGVGAVCVVAASGLLNQTRTDLSVAKSDREQAQVKLTRATDEEREIREKLVDYRKLVDRGMIGDEQRLDWVDRISEIKTARKLFDVKYSIEPQRPVDYPGMATKGEVEFLASPMKLDMALLHEEDLFRFIGDLRGALSAYLVVRVCNVNRAESATGDRGNGPRLRATCEIDLVTVRDRQARRS